MVNFIWSMLFIFQHIFLVTINVCHTKQDVFPSGPHLLPAKDRKQSLHWGWTQTAWPTIARDSFQLLIRGWVMIPNFISPSIFLLGHYNYCHDDISSEGEHIWTVTCSYNTQRGVPGARRPERASRHKLLTLRESQFLSFVGKCRLI